MNATCALACTLTCGGANVSVPAGPLSLLREEGCVSTALPGAPQCPPDAGADCQVMCELRDCEGGEWGNMM